MSEAVPECQQLDKTPTRSVLIILYIILLFYIILQVCQKQFRSVGNLKRHLLIHTEEKPFSCEICAKCFRTSDEIKKHTLVHTREKPYSCSVCQKQFKQSCHLGRHMLIHSGVKQHACVICEKKFTQPEGLRSHMLLHTGAKPFCCDSCGETFKRRWQLTAHMATHDRVDSLDAGTGLQLTAHMASHGRVDSHNGSESRGKVESDDRVAALDMSESRDGDYTGLQDGREIIIKTEVQDDNESKSQDRLESLDMKESCNDNCGLGVGRKIVIKTEVETGDESLMGEGSNKIVEYLTGYEFYHKDQYNTAGEINKHLHIDNVKKDKHNESNVASELRTGKGEELHTQIGLKTRDRIHKRDKVHICEVCLKQFPEAPSLKSHMLTHTAEEITASKVFQKHFEYGSYQNYL